MTAWPLLSVFRCFSANSDNNPNHPGSWQQAEERELRETKRKERERRRDNALPTNRSGGLTFPADTSSAIPFTLPGKGKVVFEVPGDREATDAHFRSFLGKHGVLNDDNVRSLAQAVAQHSRQQTHAATTSATPSYSHDDPAFLLQGLPPLSPLPPTPYPPRSSPATLLIIYHSRTGQGEQMARSLEVGALEAGTQMEQDEDLVVEVRRARDAQVADLLAADGFLFCAPENLASVSGEMKEFFDRCYYGALGHLNGRPFGLAISDGTDGHGAATQVARICQGWRLRPVAEPLIVRNGAQTPEAIAARKALAAEGQEQCSELGGLVAAHLLMAK